MFGPGTTLDLNRLNNYNNITGGFHNVSGQGAGTSLHIPNLGGFSTSKLPDTPSVPEDGGCFPHTPGGTIFDPGGSILDLRIPSSAATGAQVSDKRSALKSTLGGGGIVTSHPVPVDDHRLEALPDEIPLQKRPVIDEPMGRRPDMDYSYHRGSDAGKLPTNLHTYDPASDPRRHLPKDMHKHDPGSDPKFKLPAPNLLCNQRPPLIEY